MNTYFVEIKEILSKQIKVDAYSESQAETIINNLYSDGNIKLNEDNCISSSVNVIKSEEHDQPELFQEGN